MSTYIQSGNVLLAAQGDDAAALTEAAVTDDVERLLAEDFGVDTVVVTVDADTLRRAIAAAPEGFGGEPDEYHYDVAFLRPGLASADALAAFGIRDGVNTAWAGEDAIDFRRLSALRTKSRMSTAMSSPHYKNITICNWRTCTMLVEMLRED